MSRDQDDLRDNVKVAIEKRCDGDESQLSAIFTPSKRVFVEAPAGFGKTTVMTGRACWLLASGEVPSPKRIMALTFSVAAARRMRADMNAALSVLPDPEVRHFKNRVTTTNFHGLAWALLRKYWKFLPLPTRVDGLSILDDNAASKLVSRDYSLTSDERKTVDDFLHFMKTGQDKDLRQLIRPFNEVVRGRFIPNGIMPYSAIISLAIELLVVCPALRSYLAAAYPIVLIDEAQDTNALCYIFLKGLLSKESGICMFGDSVQRIYGFIGAVSELKERASADLRLLPTELKHNHRFSEKSIVGELGVAIRANMKGGRTRGMPQLPLFVGSTQEEEAAGIVAKVTKLVQDKRGRIAILVRKRGHLADLIMKGLDEAGISHFNGLFSDTSPDFIEFNTFVYSGIAEAISDENGVSRSAADRIIKSISEELLADTTGGFEYGHSYAMLLGALCKHLAADCASMSPSERYDYIASIFSEGSLRRFSDYLDADISMMTIHSAKGLEWDNVFLPGITCFDWPGGTCVKCRNSDMYSHSGSTCHIVDMGRTPDGLIEEVGLLYVGVTRARRSVYASASMERVTQSGSHQSACPSCLVSLPGITPIAWSTMDTEG